MGEEGNFTLRGRRGSEAQKMQALRKLHAERGVSKMRRVHDLTPPPKVLSSRPIRKVQKEIEEGGGRKVKTEIRFTSVPKVRGPIMIEGLPGVGHVGKLATEHLIEEFGAQKFADLYSPHFPHHVIVEKDGSVRLPRNSFYLAKVGGKDLIIVAGDAQAVSSEGYYEIANKILDLAERFGVKRLFALGGYATGRYTSGKPRVVVSATDPSLLKECGNLGISGGEETGSIVGTTGLLLGLGKVRGIEGICLLGETHGALIDHRSTQSVLEVLGTILGIKINTVVLEERAREVERMLAKFKREFERREAIERQKAKEELWYIG